MTSREINYTASVISVFAAAGLVMLMLFNMDSQYLNDNYALIVVFFTFVLAFPYFMLKLFFYINAHHNQNQELQLAELPKDQDDIERTH